MKFEYVSRNEVNVTPEVGENVETVATLAVSRALQDIAVWNVVIVLPVSEWAQSRIALQTLGYLPAGNKSVDNTTLVKLKCAVRRSGDGGTESVNDVDLAVNPPVLPPTATEQAAINEMLDRPEYATYRDRFRKGFYE
jgi:hypothetical protein